MKETRLIKLTKNIFLSILTTLILFSFESCAKKITFLTSSVVPAARGSVNVKRDKNKNYVIQIHLLHLAEVNRLQPPKQTYVVWMVTDQNIAKNLGQIKSSTSFLSKKIKGSLETVSAFKPTKIFITAEDDGSIQYPGMQVVLSTDNF